MTIENGEPVTRLAVSRGFTISYEDVGSGRAVVLVPGAFGCAADWRTSGYVDRLAESRRVLSVDPLGHGRSDKPYDARAYTAPGVAADIVAAMDAAGVARAAVWGYSRGVWLASLVAIEFPERVSALVVGGQDLTAPRDPNPPWLEPLALGDWDAFWPLFMDLSEEQRRPFQERNDPRAIAAVFSGPRQQADEFDLARVRAPALVYCGGDDEPESVRPTARALGTQLTLIGSCDHMEAFDAVELVLPIAEFHIDSVGA